MEQREQLIDIVWAVVLIQGAITLLSFLEALVIGASQGIPFLPAIALTGLGAGLAFGAARGLRRRRRWARRVTLVAESLVLVLGIINVIATMALTEGLGLMPVLTTVVVPVVVIVMLRRAKPVFAKQVFEGAA